MTHPNIAARLRSHLHFVRCLYPRAWDHMALFRRMKGDPQIGDWPAWCWVPLAGALAAISEGNSSLIRQRAHHTAIVGALAAWRQTQGIYTIHPTLMEALWVSSLEGEIPPEVLHRIPEWCVYVPTPGRGIATIPIAGFFAHLEHDANDGRMELRLLLDTEDGPLLAIPLHVWMNGGLVAAARRASEEAAFYARAENDPTDTTIIERVGIACAPLVNIVLYLCSRTAELRTPAGEIKSPRRHPPSRTPNAPITWDVGFRVGPALDAAMTRQSTTPRGTHASPRPHVRRGHFATYWTGPKITPQTPVLHWIPPIPIGTGPIVPTIRPTA